MNDNKSTPAWPQDEAIEPAQIFDDVYYIGRKIVGVFIVKTSEGLVMIDSMDPVDADEKYILPGMEKLGLDPKDLKLIIITHGHFDHYAGARRLQDKFGCKAALGRIDCGFMVTCPAPISPLEFPFIDVILEDRKEIVMGDHYFLPVLTPGHTSGGMSLIFNCFDGGKEHRASLWVGAGLPRAGGGTSDPLKDTCDYIHSIQMFAQLCESKSCDVVLGVHPHRCGLFEKLDKLQTRMEGEEHPFVVGADGVRKNLKELGLGAIQHAQKMIDTM